MNSKPWFLDPEKYRESLSRYSVSETQYVDAINAIQELYAPGSIDEEHQAITSRTSSLSHSDLQPSVNMQHLPYNPIPVLWSLGLVDQLLYLGLAITCYKNHFENTKALSDLKGIENFRGALFEVEVGSFLAKCGSKTHYQKSSPDFVVTDHRLGIEAVTRNVPLKRAVANNLGSAFAMEDFGALHIELRNCGDMDADELTSLIKKQFHKMVSEGLDVYSCDMFRITSNSVDSMEKTLHTSWGVTSYANEASSIIASLLRTKTDQVKRAKSFDKSWSYIIAVDLRSLFNYEFVPQSEYENNVFNKNLSYFESQNQLRQSTLNVCQRFVNEEDSIIGVLAWVRKKLQYPLSSDSIHSRYSVLFITRDSIHEVTPGDFLNSVLRCRS